MTFVSISGTALSALHSNGSGVCLFWAWKLLRVPLMRPNPRIQRCWPWPRLHYVLVCRRMCPSGWGPQGANAASKVALTQATVPKPLRGSSKCPCVSGREYDACVAWAAETGLEPWV